MIQPTQARSSSGLFAYPTLAQVGSAFLDLLFPPSCVHCGRVDTGFCPLCLERLSRQPLDLRIRALESGILIASTGWHEYILQSAVQALKYHNQRHLAVPLGQRMVAAFRQLEWTIDIIVPVPLHTSRLRERGYNQSQEMASVLAEGVPINCQPDAIERSRVTRSQVGLTAGERKTNLNDAFAAHPEHVAGKTLLLIDDVQTTGTTLMMCAEAALQAGVKAVYGLTVTAARR